MGGQGWPAFKEEEVTRSDEMTESCSLALIYVRRSMVRYRGGPGTCAEAPGESVTPWTVPAAPNLRDGDYLPDARHEAVTYAAGVVSVARELLEQGSVLQRRTQYEGPLCKRCWYECPQ